jgi:hypothetical protein
MRRSLSAVAFAGLVVLAGCSSGGDPAPSASSSAPADGVHDEAHVEALPSTAPAEPSWTDADVDATRLLALDLLRTMALDVPAEPWFGNIAGYLTATGQAAFYGTDPVTIPFEVVRDAEVASPSPYLAEAIVDTDAGLYSVLMVRAGAGAPWKVERAEPLG